MFATSPLCLPSRSHSRSKRFLCVMVCRLSSLSSLWLDNYGRSSSRHAWWRCNSQIWFWVSFLLRFCWSSVFLFDGFGFRLILDLCFNLVLCSSLWGEQFIWVFFGFVWYEIHVRLVTQFGYPASFILLYNLFFLAIAMELSWFPYWFGCWYCSCRPSVCCFGIFLSLLVCGVWNVSLVVISFGAVVCLGCCIFCWKLLKTFGWCTGYGNTLVVWGGSCFLPLLWVFTFKCSAWLKICYAGWCCLLPSFDRDALVFLCNGACGSSDVMWVSRM